MPSPQSAKCPDWTLSGPTSTTSSPTYSFSVPCDSPYSPTFSFVNSTPIA